MKEQHDMGTTTVTVTVTDEATGETTTGTGSDVDAAERDLDGQLGVQLDADGRELTD